MIEVIQAQIISGVSPVFTNLYVAYVQLRRDMTNTSIRVPLHFRSSSVTPSGDVQFLLVASQFLAAQW